MKKLISIILIGFVLSGCTLFHTHKIEIVQGNIITDEDVNELHRGMSEKQVRTVMGTPLLVNIFTANRIEYVYTYDNGYGRGCKKHLTCLFQNGRLVEVIRS